MRGLIIAAIFISLGFLGVFGNIYLTNATYTAANDPAATVTDPLTLNVQVPTIFIAPIPSFHASNVPFTTPRNRATGPHSFTWSWPGRGPIKLHMRHYRRDHRYEPQRGRNHHEGQNWRRHHGYAHHRREHHRWSPKTCWC